MYDYLELRQRIIGDFYQSRIICQPFLKDVRIAKEIKTKCGIVLAYQ